MVHKVCGSLFLWCGFEVTFVKLWRLSSSRTVDIRKCKKMVNGLAFWPSQSLSQMLNDNTINMNR